MEVAQGRGRAGDESVTWDEDGGQNPRHFKACKTWIGVGAVIADVGQGDGLWKPTWGTMGSVQSDKGDHVPLESSCFPTVPLFSSWWGPTKTSPLLKHLLFWRAFIPHHDIFLATRAQALDVLPGSDGKQLINSSHSYPWLLQGCNCVFSAAVFSPSHLVSICWTFAMY